MAAPWGRLGLRRATTSGAAASCPAAGPCPPRASPSPAVVDDPTGSMPVCESSCISRLPSDTCPQRGRSGRPHTRPYVLTRPPTGEKTGKNTSMVVSVAPLPDGRKEGLERARAPKRADGPSKSDPTRRPNKPCVGALEPCKGSHRVWEWVAHANRSAAVRLERWNARTDAGQANSRGAAGPSTIAAAAQSNDRRHRGTAQSWLGALPRAAPSANRQGSRTKRPAARSAPGILSIGVDTRLDPLRCPRSGASPLCMVVSDRRGGHLVPCSYARHILNAAARRLSVSWLAGAFHWEIAGLVRLVEMGRGAFPKRVADGESPSIRLDPHTFGHSRAKPPGGASWFPCLGGDASAESASCFLSSFFLGLILLLLLLLYVQDNATNRSAPQRGDHVPSDVVGSRGPASLRRCRVRLSLRSSDCSLDPPLYNSQTRAC